MYFLIITCKYFQLTVVILFILGCAMIEDWILKTFYFTHSDPLQQIDHKSDKRKITTGKDIFTCRYLNTEYTCLNLVLNLHCRDENTLFIYAEENARGLLCQNEPDHPVNRLSIIHTSNIYLMANMQFPEQDMEHGLKGLNKVNSRF